MATEYVKTPEMFRSFCINHSIKTLDNMTARIECGNGLIVCWNYSIRFDSDTDYDYFASESSVNDGTLAFVEYDIKTVIDRVIKCGTYCKTKGQPENGDYVTLTVGNFVIIEDENPDRGDWPWLKRRTTVMLPIKYERAKRQ